MTNTTVKRRPISMGAEAWKYILSILILGVGGGGLYGLSLLKKPPENIAPTSLIPLVKTYNADQFTGQMDLLVSGIVVPFREIKVAAEVSGRIVEKSPECEAGSYVKKGTRLLAIEDTDYRLELKRIEADVNQALKGIEEIEQDIVNSQRNVELAQQDYDLQRVEYERNMTAKRALSQSEVNTAERNFLNAKTQLTSRQNTVSLLKARKEKLQATVELSKSQLDRARLDLERTVIVAPDDGVIVREMAEQGDYVARGAQLITFEDTSRSEVLCNLTRDDLAWIRRFTNETVDKMDGPLGDVYRLPRTSVSVFEQSQPDRIWAGMLERFDGIGLDDRTKTIPCRIVIDQPVIESNGEKRALVRGMYVKCRFEVYVSSDPDQPSFVAFPEIGLRPGNYVWVVRDGKLHRVDVEVTDYTTLTMDGEPAPFIVAEIIGNEGLRPNDQIVITPLSQPTEGGLVEFDQGNGTAATSSPNSNATTTSDSEAASKDAT